MPSVFTAQLSELGNVYQVTNVFLSEAKYILPNAKFIDLPSDVALEIKNALNMGKSVSIEKKLIDFPFSKDIPIRHFTVEEAKTLDQMKSTVRAKVHQRISAYTALLSAFDIFEFFMITGKLVAAGYDILYEQKKEETYLDIINTGNEDLISDLERFLEIKDVFDRMMKKYRGLKQYFKEVDDCDTEEELKEVIESNQGWLVN